MEASISSFEQLSRCSKFALEVYHHSLFRRLPVRDYGESRDTRSKSSHRVLVQLEKERTTKSRNAIALTHSILPCHRGIRRCPHRSLERILPYSTRAGIMEDISHRSCQWMVSLAFLGAGSRDGQVCVCLHFGYFGSWLCEGHSGGGGSHQSEGAACWCL